MGIIIRWLCWPLLSVSAVMAPASGELQDTAVRKSVCASMVYTRPKYQNKMNSIPTITFQSFPIKGPPFCQRRTCTSNSRDLFIQAVYCQLLFLALPISALCLHKIATFITHLPSHEIWQLHICFHLLHFQGTDPSTVSERHQLRFVKHGLKANSFLTWNHDWISYHSTYGIVKLSADV